MTDTEFLAYMQAAAEDRVLVSGEQVDRLRALGGFIEGKMPGGWWGPVDPANVEWMVGRARKRSAA